ncbi:MAG: dihydropteroate synthase [Bacteroidetes bacterium]|jgi:dihydropteroate synthase|nr:dihydropteroate synthase [Bacteroidota bacterium]
MSTAMHSGQIVGKNKSFSADRKFISGNKTLALNHPHVMGILNLTPDSFYSGSRFANKIDLIERTAIMISEGASVIDIGAVSTRPNAEIVTESEEIDRLIAPLEILCKNFPDTWFSVDTFRSKVAKIAIETGAALINDISGGTFDDAMFPLIASRNTPYVLMHISGNEEHMHQNKIKKEEVAAEVHRFFQRQSQKLINLGASQIILDPGLGFNKSLEANYRLLGQLQNIALTDFPLLVGVSRKSMINKVLNINPPQSLNGTSVLHTLALQNGANFLRAHDVKEAMECIMLWEFFQSALIDENV